MSVRYPSLASSKTERSAPCYLHPLDMQDQHYISGHRVDSC